MVTLANSENPDEMPQNAAFHQTRPGMHLFDLILYVPSTIFQSYRDGSSWVEPVIS